MPETTGHITGQINRKLVALESHLVAARKLRGRIDARVRALAALVAERRNNLDAARSLLRELTQLEKQASAGRRR